MPVNTPSIKGVTSIVWGTLGQVGSPLATAIVESIAVTPKNAGPIASIENGNGAEVVTVLLSDGFDAKVTCVHDPAITWPVLGATVALTTGKGTGYVGTTVNCFVCGDPEISTSRKQEGKITINLRYRPGITV